jgi:hypothetical protein
VLYSTQQINQNSLEFLAALCNHSFIHLSWSKIMHKRGILFSAVILIVTGCTTPLVAYKNRPFGVHSLDQTNPNSKLYVLTAERRLGFLIPKDGWNMKFCAESLPEAAVAQGAKSTFDISLGTAAAGTDTAKLMEEFSSTLTKTFDRTEKAEFLRHMGWQLCSAWAQGVFTDAEYKAELKSLIKSGSNIFNNVDQASSK